MNLSSDFKSDNLAAIKNNRELSGTHSVTMPLMTKIATSEVLNFDFDDGNIQYSFGIQNNVHHSKQVHYIKSSGNNYYRCLSTILNRSCVPI